MSATSTKPYLLRAIYEWCNDCGYTPYLSVSVDERTVVPFEHVVNGEIVLNVSPAATHALTIGNDLIEFQARFGGVARQLSIPVDNVSAIYARENGHGMAFEVSAGGPAEVDSASPDSARDDGSVDRPVLAAVPDADETPTQSSESSADDGGDDGGPDAPPPLRRRPRLTRVK